MRRPTRETMRSMTRRRCSSEANRAVAADQLAAAFDVDHVRPVDHDLGDGGVVQQALQRAVAEHVVVDVVEQPLPLLGGQRNVLLLDDVHQFLPDQRMQLLLAQRGVVESGAHPLEQRLAGAFLQLAQRVDRREGRGDGGRRAGAAP